MQNTVRKLGLVAASVVALMMPAGTASLAQGDSLAAAPPSAQPFGSCTFGFVCGNVHNHAGNPEPVRITSNWGDHTNPQYWKHLQPGQDGPDVKVQDTDGFYVWTGCKFTLGGVRQIGPGWHKVRDHHNIQISSMSC